MSKQSASSGFFDISAAEETDFGFAFGGGVNVKLGDSWGLQGDIHIHGVHEKGTGANALQNNDYFISPAAGIYFRF